MINLVGNYSCKIVIVTNSKQTFDRLNKTSDAVFFVDSNDFSTIRNYGLHKIETKWVFMLDDDETLLSNLDINSLTNNYFDGYWFKRRLYVNDKKYLKFGLFYPDYQLRFFKKNKYTFHGKLHETLNIPKEKTLETDMEIAHYQNPSKVGALRNFPLLYPYIRLEGEELAEGKLNAFQLFFIGIWKFIDMFFIALTRGKGILDGWDGVRAHFMFASSITLGYFYAIILRLRKISK